MYAIGILRDSPQYRKSKATQSIQKLNSTLGFSKHILLPETLTWSKKSSGHDQVKV